jgi:predicted HAD superfamily Cof-like phosphohydrolase
VKSEFQEMVSEFHRALDFPVRDVPTVPGDDEVRLRARLILEETAEVLGELYFNVDWGAIFDDARNEIENAEVAVSLPALAHELADLHYVVSGTSAQLGINEGPVFAAVNAANMAKAGGGKDERGKARKPAGWAPADIASVLREQGWTGDAEAE